MRFTLNEDYRVCQEDFCLNAAKKSREKSLYFIKLKEKKKNVIERLKQKEKKRLELEAEKEAKITKYEADKLRKRLQRSRRRLLAKARRAEEDITPVHCGYCHRYYKNKTEHKKHLVTDFHKRNVVKQGVDVYIPRDRKGRCKECGTYAHRQTCSFLAKIMKARAEEYVKNVKRRKRDRIAYRKRSGSTLRDDDYYTRSEEV
tara:strand:- start:44 stop:649 length:606 start_codon:yes stop_codon:yes gene_type:complete